MSNHKFIYSILFSHRIILFLGIVILFSGCANEDEPEQGPVNRTVLIYMLSNNNLGSTYRFDTQNINDMLQVAASGGLNGGNLIIYRDGYDTNPQLIQIRKNESGSAEKAIIKEYPDRNSATTEVMRSVIDETKELFPAKEYGLILERIRIDTLVSQHRLGSGKLLVSSFTGSTVRIAHTLFRARRKKLYGNRRTSRSYTR